MKYGVTKTYTMDFCIFIQYNKTGHLSQGVTTAYSFVCLI